MAFTLNRLATQVPLPTVVSNFINQADYNVTSSIPALNTAKTLPNGSSSWGAKVNQNAALLEIISRQGAGVIGLVNTTGLVISAGSGLTLNISTGHAVIEGQLEYDADTVTVQNGTNYVYAKSDGTFEAVLNSITPPVTKGCFIGVAIAAAGVITSVDNSGVIYLRSGICYRKTFDVDYPLDVPPSNWLGITETQAGFYLWTGTSYICIDDKLKVQSKTSNYQILSTDRQKVFTNEGASGTVQFTLPAAANGEGSYTFIIQANQTLRITAGTGDTIRLNSSVSAAAGNVANNTIGNVITLVCINVTEWYATSHEGTWTVT